MEDNANDFNFTSDNNRSPLGSLFNNLGCCNSDSVVLFFIIIFLLLFTSFGSNRFD